MKYKLTNNIKKVNGITLYQIEALKDFGSVKTGDLGGFVESETNLSHERNSWVYGTAWVYGNAMVYGNAQVYENAQVSGNAEVYGNAKIFENQYIKFSRVVSDLSLPENLFENIRVQTNLGVCNDEVYCYKHVNDNLSSLHDENFRYKVGEWIEVTDPDISNESCAPGLHVSHASYWEGNNGNKVLFCKVRLEDIITVQEGKIRCKKLFVIGVCDGPVF